MPEPQRVEALPAHPKVGTRPTTTQVVDKQTILGTKIGCTSLYIYVEVYPPPLHLRGVGGASQLQLPLVREPRSESWGYLHTECNNSKAKGSLT